MPKILKIILFSILALILLALLFVFILYFTRLQTLATVEKITSYEDQYDLYRMDVKYDYSLDNIIDAGITDDQSFVNAVISEVAPLIPIEYKASSFGCTAFSLTSEDDDVYMGRNYDFKNDTSAMLVYCTPKDGYRSVAFAAMDNLSANVPDASLMAKFSLLASPFVCLDGMNEKGVAIAVLALDSKPTAQDTGKPKIATTLAIRLVLDKAATTEEAIALLEQYDMLATYKCDYHFYISDASGDARIVEYDCESAERTLVATPTEVVTNFYIIYEDQVFANRKNGIYGHGRERYDAVLSVLDAEKGTYSASTVWAGLQAAAQDPKPNDKTSNTQWSISYNQTDLTAEIVIRRNWEDVIEYSLENNSVEKK